MRRKQEHDHHIVGIVCYPKGIAFSILNTTNGRITGTMTLDRFSTDRHDAEPLFTFTYDMNKFMAEWKERQFAVHVTRAEKLHITPHGGQLDRIHDVENDVAIIARMNDVMTIRVTPTNWIGITKTEAKVKADRLLLTPEEIDSVRLVLAIYSLCENAKLRNTT